MKIEKTGYNPPELKYKKVEYAQSNNSYVPRQFFVGCFIGQRGGGKTYSATQLLKTFEQEPPLNKDGSAQGVRTFIISPTYEQQEVFQSLKSVDSDDVYLSYNDSIMKEILEKIEKEKQETEIYRQKMDLLAKFKKIKKIESLTTEQLIMLDEMDYEEPEPPRYPNGVSNFLIVDDMVGSAIFRGGSNPFVNLLLRNRHHRINIMIMAQNLKSVNKSIRNNVSMWWVSKFAAKATKQDLYDEFGNELTEEQFFNMYDYATSQPYGSLVIDYTQPKEKRFSVNCKEYILP